MLPLFNPPLFSFLVVQYYFLEKLLGHSVADPGFGAFLTPGSGMGTKSRSGSGMNIPDQISESLETIFGVNLLKFFVANPESF
jgi:hypothetical protein